MASTTGNAREFPKVLQNGIGQVPDADEVMANFDKVSDMFFVCTQAQLSVLTPDTKTIYYITDCEETIALRIYRNGAWYSIPLMAM